MRRLAGSLLIGLLLMAAGIPAAAQKAYPVFTREDFFKFMKSVAQNFGAVTASIGSGDFEAGKSQLTRSREQLAVTVTFWRDRKRDDALKFLKDTLTRMDQLDDGLSEEKIDPAKVGAALQQVNAACEACHAVYRDFDRTTKTYTFKPEVPR
jgi:cytochrome c556